MGPGTQWEEPGSAFTQAKQLTAVNHRCLAADEAIGCSTSVKGAGRRSAALPGKQGCSDLFFYTAAFGLHVYSYGSCPSRLKLTTWMSFMLSPHPLLRCPSR